MMNQGYASQCDELQQSVVIKLGLRLVGRKRLMLNKVS